MTQDNLHLIVGHEIGAEFAGDKRYYNRFCSRPLYAGGDSGVTIGIGYDLGYHTRAEIRKDWGGKVSANHIAFFLTCAGVKGERSRRLITVEARRLTIPYETAIDVFMTSSLPKFTEKTKQIYPNLPNLNETTQAVLIGLVYNRGSSLVGDRRIEMRELVEHTNNADYIAIADTIERMKRLWVGTTVSGLVARREYEAEKIRNSIA